MNHVKENIKREDLLSFMLKKSDSDMIMIPGKKGSDNNRFRSSKGLNDKL